MTQLPSRWTTINDFSKTIITLASALLGATIAFSAQLLGSSTSGVAVWLIRSSWVVLLVSVITSLLVAAFVYEYLAEREKRDAIGPPTQYEVTMERRTHRFANASYVLLGFGVISFLSAAFFAGRRPPAAEEAFLAARQYVERTEPGARFQSLRLDPGTEEFVVDYAADGGSTLTLEIDSQLRVVSATKR